MVSLENGYEVWNTQVRVFPQLKVWLSCCNDIGSSSVSLCESVKEHTFQNKKLGTEVLPDNTERDSSQVLCFSVHHTKNCGGIK